MHAGRGIFAAFFERANCTHCSKQASNYDRASCIWTTITIVIFVACCNMHDARMHARGSKRHFCNSFYWFKYFTLRMRLGEREGMGPPSF